MILANMNLDWQVGDIVTSAKGIRSAPLTDGKKQRPELSIDKFGPTTTCTVRSERLQRPSRDSKDYLFSMPRRTRGLTFQHRRVHGRLHCKAFQPPLQGQTNDVQTSLATERRLPRPITCQNQHERLKGVQVLDASIRKMRPATGSSRMWVGSKCVLPMPLDHGVGMWDHGRCHRSVVRHER